MGIFEIFTGRDGQFYWHLKAPNGQVLCVSEGYTQKHNAQAGVDACKKYASTALVR
ncbi:MAG: YegP family protein [Pseudobdellovibrionaceae bacterium]